MYGEAARSQSSLEAEWKPATKAQEAALESEADLLLLGGSAGSLKTSTMLVDSIQEKNKPWAGAIRAIFFRKTYKQLEEAMLQARELFPQTGGVATDNGRTWSWPSHPGMFFKFRHLEYEKYIYDYWSHQFTGLYFDESTQFEETYVRKLMSRVRSTNRDVRLRTRLGTNPGGVGGSWHRSVFFPGTKCPHCDPLTLGASTRLRWDARWPSDGTMLGNGIPGDAEAVSVQFIPSSVREHDLLGRRYIANLRMQNPATASALLAGCWEQFEGQYFKCWDPSRMVIPNWLEFAEEIGYKWWWPHFVSVDYGFSISEASSHLWTIRPPWEEVREDGARIARPHQFITIDEYTAHGEDCEEFARSLGQKWLRDSQGKPVKSRFHGFYLSPDCWAKSGMTSGVQGIYSRAEQMNAILGEYGHQFEPAANDREGGATHMYSSLNNGEWVICGDRCPKAVEAIPSRIHDPKHQDDVLKVKSDPLDDVYDDLRYGKYSHKLEERQPIEERIEEAIEGKDPLNSFLISAKMKAEEEKENEPIVFGGKAARKDITGRKPRNLFPRL